MQWTDWVEQEPKTKTDIQEKIKNNGYTYPHYDRKRNRVKFEISERDIIRDCNKLNLDISEVYPLQTTLFD